MTKKLFAALLAFGLVTISVSAQTATKGDKTESKDIVEIAAGNKDFSKLVAAVKAADLVDTLKGKGPFTVFAPTDKAFEALGEDTLKAVLADKEKLTKILTAHVIKDKAVLAADVIKLDGEVVNGYKIKVDGKDVSLVGPKVTAKVIKTDIKASNGVIHVIDAVLLPVETAKKGKGKKGDK